MANATLPARERGVCTPAKLLLKASKADDVAAVLRALGDPTRLQIALLLRDSDDAVCICDLVATFELSQPTLSHHMAKLREAGLVESTKAGIWSYYRLVRDLAPGTQRVLAAL